MASVLVIPNSGIISFDSLAYSNLQIQPLSTSPRISYDGAGGIKISSQTFAASALERFSVEGNQGRLFTVSDVLTGILFSVNDISGLPILEVKDTDTITAGKYNTNTFIISGTRIFVGLSAYPSTTKLAISGNTTIVGTLSTSGVITALDGNSNQWNNTYTNLIYNSASYLTGASLNYVNTTFVKISGDTMTGTLSVAPAAYVLSPSFATFVKNNAYPALSATLRENYNFYNSEATFAVPGGVIIKGQSPSYDTSIRNLPGIGVYGLWLQNVNNMDPGTTLVSDGRAAVTHGMSFRAGIANFTAGSDHNHVLWQGAPSNPTQSWQMSNGGNNTNGGTLQGYLTNRFFLNTLPQYQISTAITTQSDGFVDTRNALLLTGTDRLTGVKVEINLPPGTNNYHLISPGVVIGLQINPAVAGLVAATYQSQCTSVSSNATLSTFQFDVFLGNTSNWTPALASLQTVNLSARSLGGNPGINLITSQIGVPATHYVGLTGNYLNLPKHCLARFTTNDVLTGLKTGSPLTIWIPQNMPSNAPGGTGFVTSETNTGPTGNFRYGYFDAFVRTVSGTDLEFVIGNVMDTYAFQNRTWSLTADGTAGWVIYGGTQDTVHRPTFGTTGFYFEREPYVFTSADNFSYLSGGMVKNVVLGTSESYGAQSYGMGFRGVVMGNRSGVLAGEGNVVYGDYSVALGGLGLISLSGSPYQAVAGRYNNPNNNALFVVGDGTSDTNRGNALELSEQQLLLNIPVISANNITTSFNSGSATGNRSFAVNSGMAFGDYSFAEGLNSIAFGSYSHAEGAGSKAQGNMSHAEGEDTEASASWSHAEGYKTKAQGNYSHAEGYESIASGSRSHAEGDFTEAAGYAAHAEGEMTSARADNTHAAGVFAEAAHERSWIWKGSTGTDVVSTTRTDQFLVSAANGVFIPGDVGIGTDTPSTKLQVNGVITATGGDSNQWNSNWSNTNTNSANWSSVYSTVNTNSANYILDGGNTKGASIMIGTTDSFDLELETSNIRRILISNTGGLSGFNSQVAFNQSLATGTNSFAANASFATATRTFAIGNNCIASNSNSNARGSNTRAYGLASSTEGTSTSASNTNAHAEGTNTLASGQNSHAEGSGCVAGPNNHAHAEGLNTNASGIASHAEGEKTIASNSQAHAEGQETTASGPYSHAEGYLTIASGQRSHAEGYNTKAENFHSHSEGRDTIASGSQCHAEGLRSVAGPGGNAHAEGRDCVASGDGSHAEGNNAVAAGINAHAEGSDTFAFGNYSHAAGRYAAASQNHTWVWHGNSTATQSVSSTRTEQFMVSAAGGVYIPGSVGIGTDNIDNALTVNGTISTGKIQSGAFIATPSAINNQTATTYVLSDNDNGRIITLSASSAISLNVPSGLPVGFNVMAIQIGTGQVSVSAGNGVTINSDGAKTKIASQHSSASLVSYDLNIFNLAGNLTT